MSILYESELVTNSQNLPPNTNYVDRYGYAIEASVLQGTNNAPNNAIATCGKFTLVFGDEVAQNGMGFNAPNGLGQVRKNTACAVFAYLESVLQVGNVNPVIYFVESENDGTGFLTFGSAVYDANTAAGTLTNGILADYLISGMNPLNAGESHAFIKIDFGNRGTLNIHSDNTTAAGNELDLFSMILHTATSALGFTSLIDENGNSTLSQTQAGPYSVYDSYLQDSTYLIEPSTRVWQGNTPSLMGFGLTYQKIGNTLNYKIYPNARGLLNEKEEGFNYVMSANVPQGDRRFYTRAEIEILSNLGYSISNYTNGDKFPIAKTDVSEISNNICFDVTANDYDLDGAGLALISTSVKLLTSNAGTFTIQGNEICFTTANGYQGIVVFEYKVKDIVLQQESDPAYYIIMQNMPPCAGDECNLVCNGSFEQGITLADFDGLPAAVIDDIFTFCTPSVAPSWCKTLGSPDLYIRNSAQANYNIPLNQFANLEPFNCATNNENRYIGLWQSASGLFTFISEGITTPLNASLMPSYNFHLSFWAVGKQISFCPGGGTCGNVAGLRIGINTTQPLQVPNTSPNSQSNVITPITTTVNALANPTCNDWQRYSFNFIPTIKADCTDDNPFLTFEMSQQFAFCSLWPALAICGGSLTTPPANLNNYVWLDSVNLQVVPQFTISKAASNSTPTPGSSFSYTITVTNSNPGTVNNVVVNDILPVGLIANGAWTCNVPSTPVTNGINITSLASGAQATITVPVFVLGNTPIGTEIENCTWISAFDCYQGYQPNNQNQCPYMASLHTCVSVTISQIDLGVYKSVDIPNPNIGDIITYEIRVHNSGPAPAYFVNVIDALPPCVTYVSHSFGGNSYNNSFDATVNGVFVSHIPAGGDAVLHIQAIYAQYAIDHDITNIYCECTNTARINSFQLDLNPPVILPPNNNVYFTDANPNNNSSSISVSQFNAVGLPVPLGIATTIPTITGNVTGQTWYIQNPLNFNTINTVFTDCVFYVEPNVQITLSETQTFNHCEFIMGAGSSIHITGVIKIAHIQFIDCYLHGCDYLWEGIIQENSTYVEVRAGNNVGIPAGTTIEDARIGIMTNSAINTVTRLDISRTFFKHNEIGVHFPTSTPISSPPQFDCATTLFDGTQFLFPPAAWQGGFYNIHARRGIFTFNSHYTVQTTTFNKLNTGIDARRSRIIVSACRFTNIGLETPPPSSAIPNNQNQCGVSVNGPNASLIQTGFGNLSTNLSSFQDCTFGIRTFGAPTRVSLNNMVNVVTGVEVYNGIGFQHDVHYNRIIAKRRGIDLWHNGWSQYVNVTNNEIFIGGNLAQTGIMGIAGIQVEENSNAIDDNTHIEQNIIHLRRARYGIAMNNSFNATITNNTITFATGTQNSTSWNFLYRDGILATNSLSIGLNCNTVSTFPLNDPVNVAPLWRAIAFETSNGTVSCNSVDGTATGIDFRNNCTGTAITANHFHHHQQGLGLHYGQGAVTGVQTHTGNVWEANTTSGATHEDINAGIVSGSAYFVSTNGAAIFDPSPNIFSVPNWFTVQGGFTEPHCNNSGCDHVVFRQEDVNLDSLIAADTLNMMQFEPQANWDLDRDLYERMKADASFITQNTKTYDFYNNREVSNFKDFYLIKESLHNISDWGSLQNTITLCDSFIRLNMFEIMANDSLRRTGLYVDSILLQQNLILHHLTDSLIVINDSLLTLIRNSTYTNVENIRTNNGEIETNEQFEENEKAVNEIALATVMHDIYELNSEQKEILENLIFQCPAAGGRAVYIARSLYRMANDTLTYNDDSICTAQAVSWRVANPKTTTSITKEAKLVSIYPNPASDKVTFAFTEPLLEEHIIVLYNSMGQIVSKYKVNKGDKKVVLSVKELISGIYHYQLQSSSKVVSSGKFIVEKQ